MTGVQEPIYRVADCEIDPARRCLRRGGEEYYLRNKTFQVLLYLIHQRERLVTKEELISKVWKDTAVSDDVLVRCVVDIRRAFGDTANDSRILKTFPRVGYRLVAPVEEVDPQVPTTIAARPRKFPVLVAAAVAGVALIGLTVVLAGKILRPSAGPIEHGEVAWWRLNEGAGSAVHDVSGHNHTGILMGSAVWTHERGRFALQFDGVANFLEGHASGAGLPCGNTPITLGAWIRTPTTNWDETSIVTCGSNSQRGARDNFHLVLRQDGTPCFSAGYADARICGVSRLDDDAWHLIAGVYEGPESNMLRIFVDGTEQSGRKLSRVLSTASASAWRVGRFLNSTGTLFRGAISDIRVYRRALAPVEMQTIYRCASGQADITGPGGPRYYLPISYPTTTFENGPAGNGPSTTPFSNTGQDYAGVQFAKADGACSVDSLRGADAGQDLYIQAGLLVPTDSKGHATEAGPYFRSRAAAPGDGLIGGTSAGYWVRLHSTGAVTVKRLNPHAIVAFAAAPAAFDPAVFHTLETAVLGPNLQVKLDGQLLAFDQGGRIVNTVSVPPLWEGPPRIGFNQGTAGIAFGAEANREQIGGQRAKNVVLFPLPGGATDFWPPIQN